MKVKRITNILSPRYSLASVFLKARKIKLGSRVEVYLRDGLVHVATSESTFDPVVFWLGQYSSPRHVCTCLIDGVISQLS